MTKRIIFTYNFAVNYILHIFSVAKISYDSEYANLYRSSVDHQDLEYLESHRYLLEFGNGKSGPFTSFCFFLPAYLNLETKDNFIKYYNLLINSLVNNNFSNFLKQYSLDFEDPFLLTMYKIFKGIPYEIWENNIKPLMQKFKKIANIFINNIDGYYPIWKQVELILKKRAKKLNKYFGKTNIIHEWEEVTGKTFLKNNYYILLCYTNKNGPDANSLSYDKNIFYYDSPDDYLRDFVSHEVGTHLLCDLILLEKFDPIRYAAFECLAKFFNQKVLKSKKLSYTLSVFNDNKFLSLYDKHYKKGIKLEKLIELALKEIK